MTRRLLAFLAAACLCLALFACGERGQTGPAPGALAPGTYVGTGTGHGGAIEVELTVDGTGRIAEVKILSEAETPEYAADAFELLPASIVQRQSLGLDAIAGATLSSHGVLSAAADAVAKAGGDPKDFGFVSTGERAESTDITFTGLPGGDFKLTGAQLKGDYELSEVDAISINSKGTEKQVHAKGVLLETILRERGVSAVEAVLGSGIKELAPSEKENYSRTNRSIHALRDIQRGEKITAQDFAILRTEKILRPGLPPSMAKSICDRTARRFIPSGEGICFEDI